MSEDLLILEGVHTNIGQYHILHGVDFAAPPGAITMLLGRNGAGKTTTLRTVMGLSRASKGAILFDGRSVVGLQTADVARLGIGYVPEQNGVFAGLTVAENLAIAARNGKSPPRRLERILELFPPLKAFWSLPAGLLSGGQRQMLAIARAIAVPHRLILVDEPSKGLSPAIIDAMIAALRWVAADGTAVLLVEQNFAVAEAVGSMVVIMDDGRVVHRTTMPELVNSAALQRRLLGLSLEGAA